MSRLGEHGTVSFPDSKAGDQRWRGHSRDDALIVGVASPEVVEGDVDFIFGDFVFLTAQRVSMPAQPLSQGRATVKSGVSLPDLESSP
jgi:hypothetical protein